MARELKAAGIRPETCVGLHYKSSPMYIILTYAIWRCGACVVPISVELVPEEKHRIIREICLEIVITTLETVKMVEPFQKGKSQHISNNIVAVQVKSFRKQPSGQSGFETVLPLTQVRQSRKRTSPKLPVCFHR